jgi:hypothetical protein
MICIPLIPQLLGGILGIVGLAKTAGGRLRGKGLALAAVVIGPLVGIAWAIGLYFVFLCTTQMIAASESLLEIWESPAELKVQAAEIYDTWLSEDVKLRVSSEEWTAFAEAIQAQYGALKNAEMPPKPFSVDQVTRDILVDVVAEFEKGEETVQISIGRFGMKMRIQNVQVGDKSLAPKQ